MGLAVGAGIEALVTGEKEMGDLLGLRYVCIHTVCTYVCMIANLYPLIDDGLREA